MKAFRVFYDVAGSSGNNTIVLVSGSESIEEALSNKIDKYEVDCPYSRMGRTIPMSLSTVKIADLSITEFLKVTGGTV
jgi:hypothetical protein